MENKYRIERTKKEVRAIGANGADAIGIADVTIVWDDEEGIGLELPPYDGVVADPERGCNPFVTPEGRKHANEVALGIMNYIIQNNLYEQNNSNSEP